MFSKHLNISANLSWKISYCRFWVIIVFSSQIFNLCNDKRLCCRTYKIRSGSEKGWTRKSLVLWISVVDLTHQPAICYIICSLTALAMTAFSSSVSLNRYLMICTFTKVKVPKYLAPNSSCLNAYFPQLRSKQFHFMLAGQI